MHVLDACSGCLGACSGCLGACSVNKILSHHDGIQETMDDYLSFADVESLSH